MDDGLEHTAVLYEAVFDPGCEHVLKGCKYVGQTIGFATPQKLLRKRQLAHVSVAKLKKKMVGFHFLLYEYGKRAFSNWTVVDYKYFVHRVDAIEWADYRERDLIDKAGGMCKDMDERCVQSLNLTIGGWGNPRQLWGKQIAKIRKKYRIFIKHLTDYNSTFGHVMVPQCYTINGYKLGKQVASVRSGRAFDNINTLASDLHKLGFVWKVLDRNFEVFVQRLSEYITDNSCALIPVDYACSDGYKLGRIAASVRCGRVFQHDEQKLTLSKAGFVWNYWQHAFDTFIANLEQFAKREGHVNVPLKHVENNGYKLGSQLASARQKKSFTRVEQQNKIRSYGALL